jgi:threonine/homoserine/homoserine lactone efflux protein
MNAAASALIGITTALCAGAVSPGPSFVMVARTAVAASRRSGLYVALGMGVGGLSFAIASLAGLQGLLLAVPSLYWLLKVAGGLYLSWIGIRIWRHASEPILGESGVPPVPTRSPIRAFATGLTTQISNPKTAVVYASVFAAFLPEVTSLAFNVAIAAIVFPIETGWYSLVALALSAPGPRSGYLRCKRGLDRLAGCVMVALGLKLMLSAK